MIARMLGTTRIGPLTAVVDNGAIVALNSEPAPPPQWEEDEDWELLNQLQEQLNEYFLGRRRVFTLPIAPKGTEFQQRVWAALREIPYGETRTYGEIAAAIGSPNASRAVGAACGSNPILLLIPCHRVVGKNGALTGFSATGGVTTKQGLLKLESDRCRLDSVYQEANRRRLLIEAARRKKQNGGA